MDTTPDWAAAVLGAINADTGVDLSGFASAFGGGGGGGPQPMALATTPNVTQNTIPTLFGPGGILYSTGPAAPVGGGGGSGGGGAGGVAPGGYGISFHTMRDKMQAKLGFKPRRKTVLYLIRTVGFALASQWLGLDINDVLFLFMHKRHGSRRHFVQTMVKAIRKGERFRHTPSRYTIPHGGGHPRGRAAPPRARRRRRRAA